MTVPYKNDFHFLTLFGLNNHTGKNFSFAGMLLYPATQSAECYPLVFIAVKYIGHIFCHTYHRQMPTKLGEDRGKTKPAVHENVVSLNTKSQDPLYHSFKMFCGFSYGLQSSFVSLTLSLSSSFLMP